MAKPVRGLVMVFTGNGKGKTTASLGMGVRAVGNGLPVLCVQFIKGRWKTGESQALARLAPDFELVRMGRGFTSEGRNERVSLDKHLEAARSALAFARESITSGRYRMVILDEILGALKANLVELGDVLHLVAEKPSDLHLVLTGRDAPAELIEVADLVTEMRPIKHHHDQGVPAQRGVEF